MGFWVQRVVQNGKPENKGGILGYSVRHPLAWVGIPDKSDKSDKTAQEDAKVRKVTFY